MPFPTLPLLLALASTIAPASSPGLASASRAGAVQVEDFAASLGAHPYFGRLTFEAGLECAPFVLHVQPARRMPLAHKAQVDALFAPWLAELGRVLQADWAGALPKTGSTKTGSTPRVHLLVLSNLPAFRSAKIYATDRPRDDAVVFWSGSLGALIAYHDERLARTPPDRLRSQWLPEAVAALLRAHHSGPVQANEERWYVDGLKVYFAVQDAGSQPEILGHPEPSLDAVRWLSSVISDEKLRAALLLPLSELIAVQSEDERFASMTTRAATGGVALPSEAQVPLLHAYQAGLWMHFLLWAQDGRYGAGTRAYLARVLADEGGPEVLAKSLGVEDLAVMDKAFGTWLDRIAAPVIASERRQQALAQKLRTRRKAKATARTASAAWDLAAELHPGLILRAATLEAQLASALGRTCEGGLDDALDFVQTVLASAPEPDRARLTEEAARLEALQSARDAFLESLSGGKRRLRFTVAGERVSAPVVRLEDAVLHLGKNKANLASLPVAALTPADLRASMARNLEDFGPSWIGNYLDLLSGAENWRRKLDTTSDAGAALSRAGDELEALVRAGGLRARLAQFGLRPLPTAEAELDDLLAQLVALGSENEDPVLSQARPGLRELTKETLGALFDARGLQAALKGQVTRLVGDVYRIRYEFDDPSDLEDFTLGEDFQRERFESWRDLGLEDSQHVAAVMTGSFMLRGYHCYRHVLSFVTPTVRYELVYPKPDGDGLSMVMVGICEDGLGHYMAATDSHDLEVYASGGHQEHVELVGEERIFYPDVTYNLVLGFDDEQEASLRVNGKRILRVTTGDLSEGDVFILAYAQKTVKIESFEIEGKLAKGALAGLRRVWLERQLEKSGF